ncbi:hypothetical protein ACOSQ2_007466 [Xanthoceras sorbifolium]
MENAVTLQNLLELGVVNRVLIKGNKRPNNLPQIIKDVILENNISLGEVNIRLSCVSTPPEWTRDDDGYYLKINLKSIHQFLLHQPKEADPFFLSSIIVDKFSKAFGRRYLFSHTDLERYKAFVLYEQYGKFRNSPLLAEEDGFRVYGDISTIIDNMIPWVPRGPNILCSSMVSSIADHYEECDELAHARSPTSFDSLSITTQ